MGHHQAHHKFRMLIIITKVTPKKIIYTETERRESKWYTTKNTFHKIHEDMTTIHTSIRKDHQNYMKEKLTELKEK